MYQRKELLVFRLMSEVDPRNPRFNNYAQMLPRFEQLLWNLLSERKEFWMRTGVPSFWLGPSERSQTKGGCAPVCIQNSLLIRLPIVTWTGAGHKHPAHHGQVWHNKVPKQVQAQLRGWFGHLLFSNIFQNKEPKNVQYLINSDSVFVSKWYKTLFHPYIIASLVRGNSGWLFSLERVIKNLHLSYVIRIAILTPYLLTHISNSALVADLGKIHLKAEKKF